MAASMQKRPDPRGKAVRRQRGLLARLGAALGAFITRYPRAIGGLAVFGVVYSFVAANALWHQPGRHPAPLMVTRLPEQDVRSDRLAAATQERGVTTYHIEREGKTPDPDKAFARPQPRPDALIEAVQKALAARGLYDGATDGVMGPKTTAAILFFEETEGLAPTGKVSKALLERIAGQSKDAAVVAPQPHDSDVTSSVRAGDDPVASLIADAEGKTEAGPAPDGTQLVMKIQEGLAKFYKDDVKPDGIAGARTRAAIRNFQKHYKMEVDGEPSQAVLDKLESIGAI